MGLYIYRLFAKVPNAPCGVESMRWDTHLWDGLGFLMHRVELKVKREVSVMLKQLSFLMQRVELRGVKKALLVYPSRRT